MAVILRNGICMPLIGFGTFRIQGSETVFNCLNTALRAGYRSIDTAVIYRNEDDIGCALEELLPKYQLDRKDIFIISKLSPKNQGYKPCMDSINKSLKSLKTSYLDLYLIHWPGASGKKVDSFDNVKLRKESWQALEECYEKGLVKAIGVSNYCLRHLEEMKSYAKIIPHVLQVEFHPHYVQNDLKKYCYEHGIHLQAYSSLGTTVEGKENPLLNDEVISEIAKNLGKTSSQILLKWAVQQEIGVIPKSTNPSHIEENIKLDFKIPEEYMNEISSRGIHCKYAWDPTMVK